MGGPAYYKAVAEKRRILRDEYGGMMTLVELGKELGYKCQKSTKAWVREHFLEGVQMGRGVRYETDLVARIIVDARGMV